MTSEAGTEIKVVTVPFGSIHPNPWNPNQMDSRTYVAARESIRAFGFIDPVTVREHPTIEGEWEVVDGEHRWRAAQDEGLEDVPIISLGAVSDEDAKRLTIILNETRGDSDTVRLGKLLAELDASLSREVLEIGLPYSSQELDNLLRVGAIDWDDFTAKDPPAPDPGKAASNTQYTVFLQFDEAQRERFDTFTGMIQRETERPLEELIVDALERWAKDL